MSGIALTDNDGFEMTDAATGSVGVGVDDGCAPACCGLCPRVRRYTRCPIPPDEVGCAPEGPDHLWVCEDVRCQLAGGGGASVAPPVIIWRRIGYVRGGDGTVIDTADVPEGEVVWNAIDAGVADPQTGAIVGLVCVGSCDDPDLAGQFECPVYEEASICAGQVLPVGWTVPRVFVLIKDRLLPRPIEFANGACGIASVQPPGSNGLCFEFRIGSHPWRGTLPKGGTLGFVGPSSIGRQCCDCVSGCSRVDVDVPDCLVPGRVTRMRCCCSCEGRFTAQFQYRLETRYTQAGSPGGPTQPPPPGPFVEAGFGTAAVEKIAGGGGGSGCVEVPGTRRGEQEYDVDGWYSDGAGNWTPVHDGGVGDYAAGEVCVEPGPGVEGLRSLVASSAYPFGHAWVVRNRNTGELESIDANFKCPAQVGGARTYTWESVNPDGTPGNEREVMRITHTGRIVRCGFISESWGGDSSFYRDGVLLYTKSFRGSRTAQREGAVRCVGTLGCGGSSGQGDVPGSGGRSPLGRGIGGGLLSLMPAALKEAAVWMGVKAISAMRIEEDAGVGDTVARLIGDELSEAYAKWFERVTGSRECGCSSRREWLNQRYPYAK